MTDALREQVLEREWQMFTAVRSAGPAPCQSAPGAFRTIRGSLFSTWSEAMLASYLGQLEIARTCGRNLLAEKYARMDGLIPALSESPLIDEIVAVEEGWQEVLRRRYPALYARCCRGLERRGDGGEFAVYLHCELETYGEPTLALYHAHVRAAQAAGRNLAIEALAELVQASGYRDLAQAESLLAGG